MTEREIISTGLTIEEAKKRFPLNRKCPSNPAPRISSTFNITGDPLDIEQCTKAVNIEPTSVKEKRIMGHFIPSGRPNVLKPEWSYNLVHEPSYEIDTCVSELLALIYPRAKFIRALVRRKHYTAGFLTSVTIYEDRGIYGLSADTIQKLAAFNYEWSLDILD